MFRRFVLVLVVLLAAMFLAGYTTVGHSVLTIDKVVSAHHHQVGHIVLTIVKVVSAHLHQVGHRILTIDKVVSTHQHHHHAEEPLPLRYRDHILFGGIPKITLSGTFRDPYIGGLYYTTIRLGSPPRKLHVQIDTGTNNMWVNCKPCPDCPGKSKLGVQPL
ncbi:aspartic proteinase 36-like isoform X2 [Impatiens glandulifera]|uniref:aspartic proteinase 36-like isoform X2 n=1 Tax=Impatiens glandulifera TaxID=253017 RepID=UPI001FB15695|nr:aspartic proteinase 36-like isoform X2 [Impatiens glandulifera]